VQVREDARVRAAQSFACGDFADAVQWLRHWVRHDSIHQGTVHDPFAELVRDAICRREVDHATAATDYASQTGLLSRRENLMLRAVPADDGALRAFAADHDLDPDEAWTAALWAGQQAKAGQGTPWPPEPHDACWCGRPVLYDDCCRHRWP
jgi:hypothetical protein